MQDLHRALLEGLTFKSAFYCVIHSTQTPKSMYFLVITLKKLRKNPEFFMAGADI
jgi:hypothetical protein